MSSFLPDIFGSSKIKKCSSEIEQLKAQKTKLYVAYEEVVVKKEELKFQLKSAKSSLLTADVKYNAHLSNFQTVRSECKRLTEEMAKNNKLLCEAVETNKENTRLKAEIEQMKKSVAEAEDDCAKRITALEVECKAQIAAKEDACAKRMSDEQTACATKCAELSAEIRLLAAELNLKAGVVVMKGVKRMRGSSIRGGSPQSEATAECQRNNAA
jgi:chromosome segregation ATPase